MSTHDKTDGILFTLKEVVVYLKSNLFVIN